MGNVKEILRNRKEFSDFAGNARKCFIVRGGIKEMIGACTNICVVIIDEFMEDCFVVMHNEKRIEVVGFQTFCVLY